MSELECRCTEGIYRLIKGRLCFDRAAGRTRILSFCLDDPEQGPVVVIPIFPVSEIAE